MKLTTNSRSSKKKSTKRSKAVANDPQIRSLEDTFQRQEIAAQCQQMSAEFQAKMTAERALHRQRIANIFALLHETLYQMHNEVLLQRQKSANERFKNWMKVHLS